MLVQNADAGVAEKDATTAVGLQSMFVRIDDNRIDFVNFVKCLPCICAKFARDMKIAAVSGIDARPLIWPLYLRKRTLG